MQLACNPKDRLGTRVREREQLLGCERRRGTGRSSRVQLPNLVDEERGERLRNERDEQLAACKQTQMERIERFVTSRRIESFVTSRRIERFVTSRRRVRPHRPVLIGAQHGVVSRREAAGGDGDGGSGRRHGRIAVGRRVKRASGGGGGA